MRRRSLLCALAATAAGAAVHPLAAQPARRRIAWVSSDRALGNAGFEAFRAGLAGLGHVDGRGIVLEVRTTDADLAALEPFALEVLATKPDLIVTQGPVVRSIRKVGTTIPVVFGFSGDPVEAGLVESFARPGANFTGLSFMALDLAGKRIELLLEVVPGLRRVAALANPGHSGESAELRVTREAAARLGLAVDYFPMRGPAELEPALAGIRKSECGAIAVFPDAGMMRSAERIAAVARERRIPAISGWAVFARRGNVLSYGPVLEVGFGRLAWYVDRILRGARPADLPVELPSKVELVVNLAAAGAIALAIPKSVMSRADEVIR
jgi:putative tryptophan/tyrosine transport system substrate-binding protein